MEFGEICDNCELLRLWITMFAGIKPIFPVFSVLKGGNFPPHRKKSPPHLNFSLGPALYTYMTPLNINLMSVDVGLKEIKRQNNQ